MLLIVGATNSYPMLPADTDLIRYAAGDGFSYQVIAQAFPNLPASTGTLIDHHHAQRFSVPWLVGGVAQITGLSVQHAFRASLIALMIVLITTIVSTLSMLNNEFHDQLLLMAILIFNPLVIRYYLAFPAIINDVAFILGVTLVVRGMISRPEVWIPLGTLIASASRQTALLIIPALVVWTVLRMRRAGRPSALVSLALAVSIITPVIAYVVTDRISLPFSLPSFNSDMVTGLFTWISSSFDVVVLAEFGVRGLLPILLVLVLLAGALYHANAPAPEARDLAIVLVVLFVTIAAQPVLGGPDITGNNVGRLLMLGYVPLIMCLGLAMSWSKPRKAPSVAVVGVTALALMIGSMHHITSLIGQNDSSLAGKFAAVSLACTAVIAVTTWSWRFDRRSAPQLIKGAE